MILAPFWFTDTCDLNLNYLNSYGGIYPIVFGHLIFSLLPTADSYLNIYLLYWVGTQVFGRLMTLPASGYIYCLIQESICISTCCSVQGA